MKKGIVVFLILALAAGGGGYYYWNYLRDGSAGDGRISSTSEDAVYVDSVAVLAGLGSGNGKIQRYSGVVEPQKTWEVKLENERTVAECFVKEGDEVKDGQKLFIYSTTEDEDSLEKAKIELERCENDIETAKSQKEQLEKEKTKASADEQLEYTTRILTAENTIKQNEYEYKTKELEITQLEDKIADATVYCEIDGVVKSVNDSNDNNSSFMSDSSDNAYITVLQVGDYRVKGTVNEQNRDQIYAGMDMLVHSRVDETVIWKGTITEINLDKGESNSDSSMYGFGYGSDNGSSTNYPFYVELESSENLILGQHVYLEPNLGQADKKDGIWLYDYYFVREENGESYVWAASLSNVLEKRKVTLGDYDEELGMFQVLEGLDGEDYILVPSEDLSEGLPVIYNDFSVNDYPDGEIDYDEFDYERDISYEDEDLDFDFDDEDWGDDGEDFFDADDEEFAFDDKDVYYGEEDDLEEDEYVEGDDVDDLDSDEDVYYEDDEDDLFVVDDDDGLFAADDNERSEVLDGIRFN